MWFKVGQKGYVVERDDMSVDMQIADVGIFVSNYTHTLDSKKRLIIPSEWREMAGDPKRLFVLPGIKRKCLCVYPAREMTRRLEKLRTLSSADDNSRQLVRMLAYRSDWVPWDSQGRIRIKDHLLEYAELADQVTLRGTFYGFELWRPETLEQIVAAEDIDRLEEAAKLAGFEDLI